MMRRMRYVVVTKTAGWHADKDLERKEAKRFFFRQQSENDFGTQEIGGVMRHLELVSA